MNERELSDLIGVIHDAGVDPDRWPTTLGSLADAFGGCDPWLAGTGPSPSDCWLVAPRTDPAWVTSYLAYYHDRNLLWQRSAHTPAGTVQTDRMVIPKPEFLNSEFYNDWARPQGLCAALCAVVDYEDGRQTVVAVNGATDFEARDVELYDLLAPHLQRAVQVSQRLGRVKLGGTSAGAVLDSLDEGVLLVTAAAKVLFANRAAEEILGDATGLRTEAGLLRTSLSAETAALQRLIGGCAAAGSAAGGHLCVSRGFARTALSVLVAPVRGATGWPSLDAAAAMVFVKDPDRAPALIAGELQRQFGLTPSEAAFALEILKGDGLLSCADRLGISLATARTHLRHIFGKTGTRRQAELAHLILTSRHAIRRD